MQSHPYFKKVQKQTLPITYTINVRLVHYKHTLKTNQLCPLNSLAALPALLPKRLPTSCPGVFSCETKSSQGKRTDTSEMCANLAYTLIICKHSTLYYYGRTNRRLNRISQGMGSSAQPLLVDIRQRVRQRHLRRFHTD